VFFVIGGGGGLSLERLEAVGKSEEGEVEAGGGGLLSLGITPGN
jgi:hypothetical protein